VHLIPIPGSKEDDFFAIVPPPPQKTYKIWTPKKGSNINPGSKTWGI
jgi:hypothetical protein